LGGEGEEGQDCWCPVLPRTLSCLSSLYRSLDTKIFEGLSQDAVSGCTEALIASSKRLAKLKGSQDSQLFLIMHLLKLREQIVPFDIDFSSTEMSLDFSDTLGALGMLVRSSGSNIFKWSADNALWRIARAPPRVYHTLHNSKKDLERELKHACEAYIMHCASQVAEPLVYWVRKADALIPEGAAARGGAVRGQAFAEPDKVKELIGNMKRSVTTLNSESIAKMELYLPSENTRNVLLAPIKSNITDAYSRLHAYMLSDFSAEEYIALGVWTPEELTAALNASSFVADSPQKTAAPGSLSLELSGGSGGSPEKAAPAPAHPPAIPATGMANGHRDGGSEGPQQQNQQQQTQQQQLEERQHSQQEALTSEKEEEKEQDIPKKISLVPAGLQRPASQAPPPPKEPPQEPPIVQQAAGKTEEKPQEQGGGKVFGGGQLPPGFVFEDGELKYVGGK